MGGLAPHRVTQRDSLGRLQNISASDYLRAAYRARVGRCGQTFVGYHPYLINTYCAGRAAPTRRSTGPRASWSSAKCGT